LVFLFGSVVFGLDSVPFFWFQAYKSETETVGFLKIQIGLISFFYSLIFSGYFFYFLNLIDILVFLLISNVNLQMN